jgi:Uma2 family endonuclease
MGQTDIHGEMIFALLCFFKLLLAERTDVHVSSDLFLYYREGEPKRRVAQDVLVSLQSDRRRRRVWKVWVEKRLPDLIFEVISLGSPDDLDEKRDKYLEMGIPMYVVLDPDYMKIPTGIQVCVRLNDRYRALPLSADTTWLHVPGQQEPVIGLRMERDEEGQGHLRAWRPDGEELRTIEEQAAVLEEQAAVLEEQAAVLEAQETTLAAQQAALREQEQQMTEQQARIAELEARLAALESRK